MIRNIIKSIIVSLIIFAAFVFISVTSYAQDELNVPEDELAKESVYPVFDRPVAVKNRNVQDRETFDIGLYGSAAITEPIYNTLRYGLNANYHFSEVHSLGVYFAKNVVGLSQDARGLKDDFNLDFTRVPYPEYSLLFDYNYKKYYGKLSVTKNGVVNTSIYFSGGAGVTKYIHKTYPTISVGVGQRFYLTSQFALKADLKLFANNAPIPFKEGALREGTDPVPSADSFSERLTLTTNLEFGVNYLF